MATEVKQRNNKVIVLAGVVIALVAFGLSLYVSRGGNSSTASNGSTVPVAVANTDLLQGAELTPQDITVEQLPVSDAPAGSVPDGTTLVNKFLAVGVSKNTPLTANLLVADANSAKSAALTVQPLDIHPGYVAMAIPVDGGGGGSKESPDVVANGMWVQPEDHIDMIVDTGSGQVRYAFQDVRVLKVGTYTSSTGGAGGEPTVFIVEIPRAQAEELAYLINPKSDFPGISGTGPHIISYVVRGPQDKGKGYLDDANPTNAATKDAPVTPQTFNNLFPSK